MSGFIVGTNFVVILSRMRHIGSGIDKEVDNNQVNVSSYHRANMA